ncbi:hypothetical protein JTE90_004686 [Oedothorax gibbosus]|uniref:Uncharacterized protein n=1 Tax=Oedothorax gibbosus TaxID=931172 RepID=A0AAV6U8R6_9ARAC|nr:hypothetical protein JTE90_004686 [Oedothorax gibbosus]
MESRARINGRIKTVFKDPLKRRARKEGKVLLINERSGGLSKGWSAARLLLDGPPCGVYGPRFDRNIQQEARVIGWSTLQVVLYQLLDGRECDSEEGFPKSPPGRDVCGSGPTAPADCQTHGTQEAPGTGEEDKVERFLEMVDRLMTDVVLNCNLELHSKGYF